MSRSPTHHLGHGQGHYSPTILRAVIFFASNPEIELTASEAARLWSVPRNSIANTFRHSVKIGLFGQRLSDTLLTESGRAMPILTAGPVILGELGYEVGQGDKTTVLTCAQNAGIMGAPKGATR